MAIEQSSIDLCLRDLRADHERQGGLSADDVYRMITSHRLTPSEAADVHRQVIDENLLDDDDDTADSDPVDSFAFLLGTRERRRLLTAEEEVQLGRRIHLGKQAAEQRAATGSLHADLAKQVRLGKEALDQLVLSNIRLVISIAKRYQGQGLDISDLVQEGILGLIRAAEKYDYTLGYKFSTYATWWIRQAITRGIGNTGRLVRLPVHYVDIVKKVRRTQATLERDLGRPPLLRELATALYMDPADVQAALDRSRDPLSLDAALPEVDRTLGELFSDSSGSAEDVAIAQLMATTVRDRLNLFSKESQSTTSSASRKEAAVLRLRYGIHDDRAWTLEEIGNLFGVTRERIRQIHGKALSSARFSALFSDLRDE